MEGRPLVILFCEDDRSHVKLVLRSLWEQRVANKVVHVADGEQALDYLHRRGMFADPESAPRPDLILLDLRLPKVDGLEVLRQVKSSEDLKTIPVVILTTSSAEQDIAQAYRYHANSYLIKPLEFDQFVQLIHDLGFYWLVWNRSPNL